MAVFPLAVLAMMAACLLAVPFSWAVGLAELCLFLILIWCLAFFRDPHREVPPDNNLLLAPADGRITDIKLTEEKDFINAPALRIGIFLSIFDVHINRAPCEAKVEKITYRKGKYRNAMNPGSGGVNESNDIALIRTDSPHDRIIVRQISGAIARRIVCRTQPGWQLAGGEKFGMIKFGSRTELYVPAGENTKCLVKVGDKVKAGLTPIISYEAQNTNQRAGLNV
ncbi:MAG: phosphatidylserine decarboxylase [Planctomycetota bacterium]